MGSYKKLLVQFDIGKTFEQFVTKKDLVEQ